MCGILSIVATNEQSVIDAQLLRDLTDRLKHRGPDDEGYFYRPQVGLGHRRLSIIDLESGKQPMSTQDKRLTIVLNGEIFNFRSLREYLEGKGAKFRTQSDTEVILEGFKLEGVPFLAKLEGMFAAVLYDQLDGKTYIFRDAFGIKPLYCALLNGFMYFSSEIHPLLEVIPKRKVNLTALDSYLHMGYVMGRHSMVEGIEKVTPGYVIEINAQGEVKEESFSPALIPHNLKEDEGTEIEPVLLASIEQSLVSDVPVGLYLSGGVDSGYLASVMVKEFNLKPKSFSVGYPEDASFDERPMAKQVADHLGIEHVQVECSQEHFLEMESFMGSLSEPLADPSAVPMSLLSKRAAQDVKVVLSGEGGDEIFGGYYRYFWQGFSNRFLESPQLFQSLAAKLGSVFGGPSLRRRIKKLEAMKHLPPSRRYARLFSSFGPEALENIREHCGFNTRAVDAMFDGLFQVSKGLGEKKQLQWIDLMTFVADGLLGKADATSMRNGLEVRVPFLQEKLVQAVFRSPSVELNEARKTKVFLRRQLAKYLPAEMVHRKKQGFELPINAWMRDGLKPMVDRYTSRDRIEATGVFPWPVVDAIRKEFYEDRVDRSAALYRIIVLEAWLETHQVKI